MCLKTIAPWLGTVTCPPERVEMRWRTVIVRDDAGRCPSSVTGPRPTERIALAA